MSEYVPIADVWARDYQAAVVLASLEDAGFHPVIECDPRGWMHFYGWPFGSSRPTTIWVPVSEFGDAAGFLHAPCEEPWEPHKRLRGFASTVGRCRKWFLGFWLGQWAVYIILGLGSALVKLVQLVTQL